MSGARAYLGMRADRRSSLLARLLSTSSTALSNSLSDGSKRFLTSLSPMAYCAQRTQAASMAHLLLWMSDTACQRMAAQILLIVLCTRSSSLQLCLLVEMRANLEKHCECLQPLVGLVRHPGVWCVCLQADTLSRGVCLWQTGQASAGFCAKCSRSTKL